MSANSPRLVARSASRRAHHFLERLRGDAGNPYSPAASLTLLLAVGVAVKFFH